jgi:hypothetical protein
MDTDGPEVTTVLATPPPYTPPLVTIHGSTGTPKITFVQIYLMTVISLVELFFRSTGPNSKTGAIVGGIVGGIGGLLAILMTMWFCWYRSRRRAALSGDPYRNREVRHAHRTDLASTAEVISRGGRIPAAGGVVSGPTPSTPNGDTDMRQYPSSQVLLNGAGALEEGCAVTATSGLPSTPSSGKGTSPAAQPHRAPLVEGRAASRQHGEGGPASSFEGEDSVM